MCEPVVPDCRPPTAPAVQLWRLNIYFQSALLSSAHYKSKSDTATLNCISCACSVYINCALKDWRVICNSYIHYKLELQWCSYPVPIYFFVWSIPDCFPFLPCTLTEPLPILALCLLGVQSILLQRDWWLRTTGLQVQQIAFHSWAIQVTF